MAAYTFSFTHQEVGVTSNSGSSSSIRIRDPPGFRALTDKALDDEVSKATALSDALRSINKGSTVNSPSSSTSKRTTQQVVQATVKKAWDISWSPVKTLGMNLVMLYFGGSTPGIFTVLIISYTLFNAFATLASVRTVFKPLEESLGLEEGRNPFVLQKIIFGLICLLMTGYIIHHVSKMGLIPLRSGDYLSLIPERHPKQKVLALF